MQHQHKPSKLFSLITGASSGIGKMIALECAKRSMNLILVALNDPVLDETAHELQMLYPELQIVTIAADLADANAAKAIFDHCQKKQLTVNMLINNAGIGSSGRFDEQAPAYHAYVVNLNLMTPLALTRLFIPELKKLDKAYILNVSSAAAFYNIPYKTIYTSTKAFVYNFTRAVREELRQTNISVSVMCSGGVVTNEETRRRTNELGYLSRKLQLSAHLVAAEAVKGMLEGKRLILPGASSKLFFITSKVLPYRLKMYALQKIYGRVYHQEQQKTTAKPAIKPIVASLKS